MVIATTIETVEIKMVTKLYVHHASTVASSTPRLTKIVGTLRQMQPSDRPTGFSKPRMTAEGAQGSKLLSIGTQGKWKSIV